MALARLIVLLALGAGAAAPVSAEAAVIVRVAPEVVVDRDEISLGDLASVEGDEPLASRLRALKLGAAPLAGASQRLDAETLRQRLRVGQTDPTRVMFMLPERVVITRAFQVVPGPALVEAVRRQALARIEGVVDGTGPGGLALVPTTRPEDLRVPTGEVGIEARLQAGPAGSVFLAAMVTVRVNGRDHRTIPLTFRAGRYQKAVVAARALEPKTVLGPADFRVESRPSTELPPDALEEISQAPDLEVLRPVRAGEVLTSRMLHQKIAVRRGEMVTLLLEGNGFRITTQGQASEDARRGDTVRVLNVSSKREILGKVDSPGVVRVPFRETRSER